MEPGARVWVRDKWQDEAWILGMIRSRQTYQPIEVRRSNINNEPKFADEKDLYEVLIELIDTSPHEVKFIISGVSESEDVKLANEVHQNDVDDLIQLPHLHEPAILTSLSERYFEGLIYTFTGPILIAINPFKKLPLYTDQLLEKYYSYGLMASQGIQLGSPLSPHVYSIADNAYREMMLVLTGKSSNPLSPVNQSILISGESGAGKTVSTKIVLKYLTTVGSSEGIQSQSDNSSIMQKVLESNPILEAFGNAKTKRNDNSSRFGKLIELNFSTRGQLIGARIELKILFLHVSKDLSFRESSTSNSLPR